MAYFDKWDNFYEDEESLEMLETINENGDTPLYEHKHKNSIKKVRIAVISVCILIILAFLLFVYSKMGERALNGCLDLGNSYDYCINHI